MIKAHWPGGAHATPGSGHADCQEASGEGIQTSEVSVMGAKEAGTLNSPARGTSHMTDGPAQPSSRWPRGHAGSPVAAAFTPR